MSDEVLGVLITAVFGFLGVVIPAVIQAIVSQSNDKGSAGGVDTPHASSRRRRSSTRTWFILGLGLFGGLGVGLIVSFLVIAFIANGPGPTEESLIDQTPSLEGTLTTDEAQPTPTDQPPPTATTPPPSDIPPPSPPTNTLVVPTQAPTVNVPATLTVQAHLTQAALDLTATAMAEFPPIEGILEIVSVSPPSPAVLGFGELITITYLYDTTGYPGGVSIAFAHQGSTSATTGQLNGTGIVIGQGTAQVSFSYISEIILFRVGISAGDPDNVKQTLETEMVDVNYQYVDE